MNIEEHDDKFLLNEIKSGNAILVLGAGASKKNKNSNEEDVKLGGELARLLAERAGFEYNNEKLTEVLGAVRGDYLSDVVINSILRTEYTNITPSDEFQDLFSYVWKRIYTWNIDDSLQNITKRSVQRRSYFNGMIDKAKVIDNPKSLHVIWLHGEASKPEHGMILTEQDYATHIKSDRHYWYKQAAQDYLAFCPIFIGSKLEEPILTAEIERAKRESNSVVGRAFLLTPGNISSITRSAFKAKGIIHINATLEDFSKWLKSKIPLGTSPAEIVSDNNKIPKDIVDHLTNDDLNVARSIQPIDTNYLRLKWNTLSAAEKNFRARQFLRGFPPTWIVASSPIPVPLEALDGLYKALVEAHSQHKKIFLAQGQSGGGKTTAIMMALIKFSDEFNIPVFEMSGDTKSVSRALFLLQKISPSGGILYIKDLIVYADTIQADVDSLEENRFMVVSTVRQGEWRERLSRHLPIENPVSFQRFSKADYAPLIERLVTYVPSPSFRKLDKIKQIERLAKSKNQLLIALRETTESDNFGDVITKEFEGLPDNDTRNLLIVVGLATISRVGISTEMAKEAYLSLGSIRPFENALEALEGIVGYADNKRLFARHEVYIRHILDNASSFSHILQGISSILRTFIKYEIPIVKSVSRTDSFLFRSLMNNNFVFGQADRHDSRVAGKKLYEDFEVEFQLDGHYWLQYGLYLARLRDTQGALEMLQRSIDAYPDNPFAVHALADHQLKMAKERPQFDTATRNLISSAVRTLELQDSQTGLVIDQYPLVTLANGHISALIKHSQTQIAKEFSIQYFDRLQRMSRLMSSPSIDTVMARLIQFVKLGDWSERVSSREQKGNRKKKRRSTS